MPYRDNPELWRERAAEARGHAKQMRDEESRRIMLSIAERYEKMAEQAEHRAAKSAGTLINRIALPEVR